jgi:hypothetical protein
MYQHGNTEKLKLLKEYLEPVRLGEKLAVTQDSLVFGEQKNANIGTLLSSLSLLFLKSNSRYSSRRAKYGFH